MISVLCGKSKQIHHYPDAADICDAAHCPACENETGMCVIVATDLDDDGNPVIQCLGNFPNCLGYCHCVCKTVEECTHLEPIQERHRSLVTPPEDKKAAGRQAIVDKMKR